MRFSSPIDIPGAAMIDLAAPLIACAALNRFRGGGLGADKLPGHPRFYVAPLIAAIALFYQSWPEAAAIGAAYLFYVWPPVGRHFTLNRLPRDFSGRAPTRFERICEWLSDLGGVRRDWLAFAIRNAAVLIPGFALVLWVSGFAGLLAADPGGAFWPMARAACARLVFAPLAVIPAFGAVALYWLGWKIDPEKGTQPAELLIGAAIGVAIAMSQELF